MISKREAVLDAAIEVLGTRGSRGLTHRAVDDVAGLPSGSTSNYFRTRDALLTGVVERLVERDRADWEALAAMPVPDTVAGIVDGTTAWVLHALGPDRARTAARYSVFLEAAATPELQGPLRRARADLVAWATGLLDAFCAPGTAASSAGLVMDYVEGVILHQLAFPAAGFDPRGGIARAVAAVVG